jgi:hypothetical protein
MVHDLGFFAAVGVAAGVFAYFWWRKMPANTATMPPPIAARMPRPQLRASQLDSRTAKRDAVTSGSALGALNGMDGLTNVGGTVGLVGGG